MKVLYAALLAAAVACATGSSSGVAKPSAQSCGAQMVPAVIYSGTQVYETPDSSAAWPDRLKTDTPACASPDNAGFGYRRVQLADGKTGYVLKNNLGE
jgi:hypothetical protein